jgi:integrase
MVADHRLNENPLSYLKAQNAKTDVRCKRRVLTNDELARLLQVTKSGVLRRGMTGKKRAMLYLLAVNTGLRAAELASLKWGQFDFNPSESSVKVLAAYSKHRRDDTQPLPSYVAQQFQDWQTEIGACADDVVFATFNKAVGAKMLQKDLAATGILYRDDAGRVADFHSLRHTYISNLTKSGISPKVAQCLARHSTITLTMDTYTHVASQSERAAVETLPVLPSVSSDEEGNSCAALKTGTDDLPVISYDNKPDHKQGLTNSQTLSLRQRVINF